MGNGLKRQVGAAVRAARKRRELTQEELAGRIGKTPEAISNIERGRALPNLVTLLDLSRALNSPLGRLVKDAPAETAKPARRLALEHELQVLIEGLDDRTVEIAIRQVAALAELRR